MRSLSVLVSPESVCSNLVQTDVCAVSVASGLASLFYFFF